MPVSESVIDVDTSKELRCPHCGRLFLKGVVIAVEIKCKCKDELGNRRLLKFLQHG
jgi:uncharacterized protein (DUF2225 family)